MEFCSAINKQEAMECAGSWKELEDSILTQTIQALIDKYQISSPIHDS